MIENVRGIMDAVFQDYRYYIAGQLKKLGYQTGWKLMNASDFGVPQLRLGLCSSLFGASSPRISLGPAPG